MRKVLFLVIPSWFLAGYFFLTAKPVETPPKLQLSKGWKIMKGDDTAYARVGWDDAAWTSIDPTQDIKHSFPQLLSGDIHWMRLRIPTDSISQYIPIALSIQQSVASEIYLNGVLIQRYGRIDPQKKNTDAFDPLWQPLPVITAEQPYQEMAVRFAAQPGITYGKMFETSAPLLDMTLMNGQDAARDYSNMVTRISAFEFLHFGLYLILLILHLSYFILYPKEKANLFFALFALSMLIAYAFQYNFFIYENRVSWKAWESYAVMNLITLSSLFILATLHKFLGKPLDLFFKIACLIWVVSLYTNIAIYGIGWRLTGAVLQLLIWLNMARISFLAMKQKTRGANVIFAGAVSGIFFFAVFIKGGTFYNDHFQQSLSIQRIFSFVCYTFSIPAAISVFLAMDFAYTANELSGKLREVQVLSDKNLAAEKEKQEILSSINEQLEKQVQERTEELRHSLEQLKTTQSQLVHAEKMASLGELTAGIAHEIQNPLNFVNNFSEVNAELADEGVEALHNKNYEEALQILTDIKANQERIREHGKRADGIVKSMLQHSRSNTGSKESADLNQLVDEYVKLAYHGMKAKDKSFNTDIQVNLEPGLPRINIVAQDIGRVLLNLLNNAFYAVNEKKKYMGDGYSPRVTVSTEAGNNSVELKVEDNGPGINEASLEKIFQPFFTTKPTGEGTGLGLSLSYDIITKGHGGKMEVSSKPGSTVFKATLPLS